MTIFGQDIKVDDSLIPAVAANGELILTDGIETALQDVWMRIYTPLGELFYDINFGSKIRDWIMEENTESARIGLENELEKRLIEDARIEPGSVSAKVIAYDEKGITVSLNFRFSEEDNYYNLVLSIGDDGKIERIIKNVKTQ